MNLIFKRLTGGYELPKEKQKRTVERVIGITSYGEVVEAKGCLPSDRDRVVKEMFDGNKDVMTINVSPMRGRTKIIVRP